jgi:two-component system alkaline phosphatase synthesis response regulator PhoP
MQRVLLLSDLPAHVHGVDQALRRDGHVVRTEANAERCLIAIQEWRPALVILDLAVGLARSGIDALARNPTLGDGVAVLALTEPSTMATMANSPGIDDFVVVPLDGEELRVRAARLLATSGAVEESVVLQRGGLLIDTERYKVTVDGGVVDLTYKEYELLRFLAQNPGKPFTREALLNQVWGYDYYGGSRTVDVHVRRIRAKIEQHEPFIETVRNVGYRFIEHP